MSQRRKVWDIYIPKCPAELVDSSLYPKEFQQLRLPGIRLCPVSWLLTPGF